MIFHTVMNGQVLNNSDDVTTLPKTIELGGMASFAMVAFNFVLLLSLPTPSAI